MRITRGKMPIRTWLGRAAAVRFARPTSVQRAGGRHAQPPGRRKLHQSRAVARGGQVVRRRTGGWHSADGAHPRARPWWDVARIPPAKSRTAHVSRTRPRDGARTTRLHAPNKSFGNDRFLRQVKVLAGETGRSGPAAGDARRRKNKPAPVCGPSFCRSEPDPVLFFSSARGLNSPRPLWLPPRSEPDLAL